MNGDQQRYFEIMKKMRFIVAIDIVLNESTVWADVVLPTLDSLERWNMTMIEPPNTEGPCLAQPVIDPLYDCKSEEEIFWEISERIGILETWNQIVNFACGFGEKPELALETDKKYSDKDIAERKGKLWNDQPLEWYQEHGHAVTKRKPDIWYRPWEGQRLHFYLEYILQQRDELKKKMEEAGVPFINEWEWGDYQALPLPVLDPLHEEPAEYDMYAITFKDVQLNFSENLSIPWIADVVYKDPVHMGILINPATAEHKGIEDGDLIEITSPYGGLKGLAKVVEGVHPETVAVSNALTRWVHYHAVVKPGGGNFNRLLPANLRNTDACSGQMETTARVKVTKLRSKPKDGDGAVVDELTAEGV
jgi:anaerobic selenocysteine-containing dehydrogenase